MTRYHPFFCEENVWYLAREPRFLEVERYAVFISNEARAAALFCQRAALSPSLPVLWDYHVVLVARGLAGYEVWDLDSTLGMPVPLERYLDETFGPVRALPAELHPRFRVVAAEAFLETFSSDRAHMRDDEGRWLKPPPPWPPPVRGESNLMRFVDMTAPFFGEVLDLEGLRRTFARVREGESGVPPL